MATIWPDVSDTARLWSYCVSTMASAPIESASSRSASSAHATSPLIIDHMAFYSRSQYLFTVFPSIPPATDWSSPGGSSALSVLCFARAFASYWDTTSPPMDRSAVPSSASPTSSHFCRCSSQERFPLITSNLSFTLLPDVGTSADVSRQQYDSANGERGQRRSHRRSALAHLLCLSSTGSYVNPTSITTTAPPTPTAADCPDGFQQ